MANAIRLAIPLGREAERKDDGLGLLVEVFELGRVDVTPRLVAAHDPPRQKLTARVRDPRAEGAHSSASTLSDSPLLAARTGRYLAQVLERTLQRREHARQPSGLSA